MLFALLFIFSALLQMVLPWYCAGILCFLLCLGWNETPLRSGLISAASQGLIWWLYVGWLTAQNEHILATRMARVLSLPGPLSLVIITGLIAAVAGGVAGFAGASLRLAFREKERPAASSGMANDEDDGL